METSRSEFSSSRNTCPYYRDENKSFVDFVVIFQLFKSLFFSEINLSNSQLFCVHTKKFRFSMFESWNLHVSPETFLYSCILYYIFTLILKNIYCTISFPSKVLWFWHKLYQFSPLCAAARFLTSITFHLYLLSSLLTFLMHAPFVEFTASRYGTRNVIRWHAEIRCRREEII